VPWAVAIVWFVVALAGCGALSGLDSIHESVCAPDCDGDDATANPADQVVAEGGSSGGGSEAAQGDVGSADSLRDVDGGAEARIDTGCGPLNTTTSCSACEQACAPTSSTVTSAECLGQADGTGATCSYTCATGWLDCDRSTNPPNVNGCECHAPNATTADCCSGGCPIQHDNGLYQSSSFFYDCSITPPQIALDACAAFTGDPTQCHAGDCFDLDGGATGEKLVCSDGSPTACVCWEYLGPAAMRVYNSASTECMCPDTTDPTFD
jgi:hypothetical protein